jgi:ribosomal protein S27E
MTGTVVNVDCPTCGNQQVDAHAVTLRVSVIAPATNNYTWRCLSCLVVVVKPAGAREVALLTSTREVEVTRWEPPAEIHERRAHAALRPALTEDDLISFGAALYATGDLLAGCVA